MGGAVDAASVGHLERICSDLVHDHGVTELLLDLTAAVDPEGLLPALVEAVDTWVSDRGGTLELRLPASPTDELVELAADVPTFAPVDPDEVL